MVLSVYMTLGRLLSIEQANKGIAKIAVEADMMDFKDKHPIIGTIFHPIIKTYYYFKEKK